MFKTKWFNIFVYAAAYIFSLAALIVLRTKDQMIADESKLYSEINKFTSAFQFRQIAATCALFMVGYVVVYVLIPKHKQISKLLLSMPMGIALWGLSSVLLLICRIPYTRMSAFVAFALAAGTILFVKRDNLKMIKASDVVKTVVIVVVLANLFSTGYPRYTVTSDTYYCVYTYGRLIASDAELDVLSTGNLMETTGIMPALMSSLAVFCGFETVNVMHFILMSSFIAGLFGYIFTVLSASGMNKYKSILLSVIIVATAISPLFLMYDLIISHSWIMVYIFFVASIAYEYFSGGRGETDKGILLIISLYLAWMSLCRIEAIVTVVFILVCMSYLGKSRKEIVICSCSSLVLATIYHAECQIMIARYGQDLPYGSVFITKSLLALMGAVVVMMLAYIILYEFPWVVWIRKRMPFIILSILFVTSICFCLIDMEKTINNFHAILFNLTDSMQRWNYFPLVAAIALMLIYREKVAFVGYWEMLTFGLILVFFIMGMGRIHPLREGWGDSFNRYLVHMVPLVLVVIAFGVSEMFAKKENPDAV